MERSSSPDVGGTVTNSNLTDWTATFFVINSLPEWVQLREYCIYRGPCFLAIVWFGSYPTPSSRKLDQQHTGRLRTRENLLTEEGVGAKSYDGEKTWSSINHSILPGPTLEYLSLWPEPPTPLPPPWDAPDNISTLIPSKYLIFFFLLVRYSWWIWYWAGILERFGIG